MATNFMVKIGKIGLFTFIRYSKLWHSETDCNIVILILEIICNDVAMLCMNLVNFGPVLPGFNIYKHVHPTFLSLK